MTFTLHPSFAEPVRTLTSPPWEVSETGWGEFEVGIAVEFAPAAGVPPLELAHGLKLHPEGPAEAAAAQQGVPVVRDRRAPLPRNAVPRSPLPLSSRPRSVPPYAVRYEEFVFVAPPAALHARLAAHVPQRAAPTEVLQHGAPPPPGSVPGGRERFGGLVSVSVRLSA